MASDFSGGMKWTICLLQAEDVNEKSFSLYLLGFCILLLNDLFSSLYKNNTCLL